MQINVTALRTDLLRFATLLTFVARPGPEVSVDFEDEADRLRNDSSPNTIEENREWLRGALRYTGNNSIFDRYVVVDGKPSTTLSNEYLQLASRLRRHGYAKILLLSPYRKRLFSTEVDDSSDAPPIIDSVPDNLEDNIETDVDSLVTDILRFSSLLKRVGDSAHSAAVNFENKAEELRSDPSSENVIETAQWLYMMLKHTGNGSIFDRYVAGEEYGSVDSDLTNEYLKLAGELRSFGQSYMGRNILSDPEGFSR